jgi:hypothetical protein
MKLFRNLLNLNNRNFGSIEKFRLVENRLKILLWPCRLTKCLKLKCHLLCIVVSDFLRRVPEQDEELLILRNLLPKTFCLLREQKAKGKRLHFKTLFTWDRDNFKREWKLKLSTCLHVTGRRYENQKIFNLFPLLACVVIAYVKVTAEIGLYEMYFWLHLSYSLISCRFEVSWLGPTACLM